MLTRREFIRSSLGCAFAMSPGNLKAQPSNPAKAIPIGFQLYTVRGEFSRDAPGTLKKLAEIGYKAVEFWGYSGTPNVFENYSAVALRKVLDENNLKCCGMHLDLKALAKENFGRTIENNQALGSEFLNLASAEGKMGSEEAIGELANLLNEREAECQKVGLTIGYHSHGFDFKKIHDRSAWEILFGKLVPEVNMQIDVGNCLGGGGDPIAMLKEFPGRTRTIHIKEHKEKTFDSDFYKEVFRLCETTSGTKWNIVEMGGLLGNGFEVPREALQKLHQLGKK